jgi:hypothetical protein
MQNPSKTRLVGFMAFVLLLASLPLSAQVLNETDLLLQPTELLNLNTSRGGSEAYIKQVGNNNDLRLMQQQEGLEGNLARVLQAGDWNVAIISQTEQGNKLALIQRGTNNYYELVNNGFENELVNIQDGQNNRIVQQLVNANQISGEMVQIGNNNEIIQILENINAHGFTVRQVGDGLKVTITRIGQ